MTNIELQHKVIASNFEVGGSTTRFRFTDRTFLLKDDQGNWNPLLTYYPEIVIDYSHSTQKRGLSTLTKNNCGNLLTAFYEHALKVNPDILTFQVFPTGREMVKGEYSVGLEKFEKGSAFMLAHGIWPSGSLDPGFRNWHGQECPYRGSRGPEGEHLKELFENYVSLLAHGTVTRENNLRDTSKAVVQALDKCRQLAAEYTQLVTAMQEVNFAPQDQTRASDRSGLLAPFKVGMKIKEQSREIDAVVRKMATLSFGIADCSTWCEVTRPTRYRRSTEGDASFYFDEGVTAWGTTPDDEEEARSLMAEYKKVDLGNQTSITDVDLGGRIVGRHSPTFSSFYGFQEFFPTFRKILSTRMGYVIPQLFGSEPEDWDILEIAAPVFLKSKTN